MKSLNESTGDSLQSRKDFKNTPSGRYKLWDAELRAAEKRLKTWKKTGDRIVTRYLGDSTKTDNDRQSFTAFRLNLFHSNVTTLYSMLYGNIPTVDVSRRYQDSSDDVGRVAAETMERLLNLDIAVNGKEYDVVLRSTLLDRLTAGLGTARVRYEVETEMVEDEFGEEVEKLVSETAPLDYYYWNDVLWSWGRNWTEIRWVAFRSYLTKDEVRERFGDNAADNIEFKSQHSKESQGSSSSEDKQSAWLKAEVWEIWDKEKREVIWYSQGYDRTLDNKPDPLGLHGFFPCPPFFLANATSTLYQPTPDFVLSQDLYNEIDTLQTRIAIITEAVKVVGVYDASADGIKRMFKEGVENELIPVDNWALFAEKGGIKGQVDWVPIQDIVGALDKLRQVRDETITLLQQVSGMSDVMNGGVNNQYEGVGQSQMKAKFGSIRVQALQDEFAQFASDLMQLKGEVIALHFEPETIAKDSNMQHSMDVKLLPQAIELIKNPKQARLRIAIRPESVAMVDYAQLKAERTDYINALSMFMQSAAPIMESEPTSKPFLLELLKWGLAGFKGASEIEGVMDKAIEAATQEQKEEQPDPAQMQAQMDQQKEQAKLQGEMQKIQAKAQADMQVRENDKQADIETAQVQHQLDMQRIQSEGMASIREIQVKAEADIQTELVQSQANIQQSLAGSQAEVRKESVKADIEINKEVKKADIELGKEVNKAQVDVAKEIAKPVKEAKAPKND